MSTVNLIVTVSRSPDDFGFVIPPTTCPVFDPAPLAPGESCDAVMRFSPSEFKWLADRAFGKSVQALDVDVGLRSREMDLTKLAPARKARG